MPKELSEMSIYERIDAAYAEIAQAKITKEGTVSAGGSKGYKYVQISQILDVVRRAHGHFGVKVFFGRPVYDAEQFEKRYAEIRKGQYGDTKWQIANGHIDVRLIGRDEEDCIEMVVPFEAQDNSDKLTNKIMTNAERTLYRTLYAIDEGEGSDPEAVNVANTVPEESPKKVDPFFDAKKSSEPPAHTHTQTPLNSEPLQSAQPMTPRQKQEAAFRPSDIPDSVYRPAIALAKRWIYTHGSDKTVMDQVKRMGTADVSKWPKAHVVDMANMTLESEGKPLLEYFPKEVSE